MPQRLREHVSVLAGDIGERNVWHPSALAAAADYIAAVFAGTQCPVRRQAFAVDDLTVCNLEIEKIGVRYPDEIILVGAHYDSVPGSPGADDNASGVAALLALAGLLADASPERTVRLVAFVNEEPPFFRTTKMGSRVYALRCRRRQETIAAMICLESIGYFQDTAGSQKYPFPLGLFYPNKGNFIGFAGNIASRRLLHRVLESFRRLCTLPAEGVAAPGWLTGVGWSDHWAFWKQGYPAVMVTDTAPFRNPYYHTAGDTPEKLDYARLARLVTGLARVLADLAANGV